MFTIAINFSLLLFLLLLLFVSYSGPLVQLHVACLSKSLGSWPLSTFMCFPHYRTGENSLTLSILRMLSLPSALLGGPKSRDPLWQHSSCNLRLQSWCGRSCILLFGKLERIGGLVTSYTGFLSLHLHVPLNWKVPVASILKSFLDSLVCIGLPLCTCAYKLLFLWCTQSFIIVLFYFLVCWILLLFSIMFFITLWVYFFKK